MELTKIYLSEMDGDVFDAIIDGNEAGIVTDEYNFLND